MFEIRDRAYSDNTISEVAGKHLPAHPTARYNTFSSLWKKTRKVGGYIPRPARCAPPEDDLFPCCLSCKASGNDLKELLARRTAYAGWLQGEWWWDFGWTLPEDFVGLGVGVTIPNVPVERDRIFVFNPDMNRGYLDVNMEAHAQAGAVQHEAKIKISNFASVNYPGEIIASTAGKISIAIPRTKWFGQGIQVSDRYIFEPIEMPFNLPILLDGGDFVKKGDKIFLNGLPLN